MRLNKMRLAAAMMSAVMAASTMSTAVYAEDLIVDEDVVTVVSEGVAADEIVEDQVELADAVTVVKSSLVYDPVEETLSFSSSLGDTYTIKNGVDGATVTATETTPATCTSKGTWHVVASYGGFKIDEAVSTPEPANHDFTGNDAEYVVTTPPSCTDKGVKTLVKKCNTCKEFIPVDAAGNVTTTPVTEEVDALGHNLTDKKTTYVVDETDNTALGDDGKPVLIDPNENGWYDIVVKDWCTLCRDWILNTTESEYNVFIQGADYAATFAYAEITLGTNVKAYHGAVELDHITADKLSLIKDEDFELTNCGLDGEYTITEYVYYGYYGPVKAAERKVTVKAHHYGAVEYVAKPAADQSLLYWHTASDGKTTVTSKSCYKPVTYVEVTKCTSVNCKLKDKIMSTSEEKTAQPGGKHLNNVTVPNGADSTTSLQAKINEVYTIAGMQYGLEKQYVEYLLTLLKTYKDNVTYTKDFTCDEGGTITVTLLCDACHEPMPETTKVIKIGKIAHKASTTVTRENEVAATCKAEGSYDLVKRCVYCDTVVETNTVKIPKLNHTFEENKAGLSIELLGDVVVDSMYGHENGDYSLSKGQKIQLYNWDYIGVSVNYGVTPKLYDTCTVCGEKVYLNNSLVAEIVDLVKDDGKGNPGSITLNVSYTTTVDGKLKVVSTGDVTFDYYRDLVSYLTKNPDKAINGLHLDNDGVWRYYKNSVCQEDYSGIVKYMGAEFFVANGVKCEDANGLNLYDGKWYMLVGGQIARGYTDLALYNGEWFYLVDGELDVTNNGLVEYNGSKFALAAGRLLSNVTGLWQNPQDGEWYYLAEGRVVNYTGTTTYNGVTFKLVDGKIVG